MKKEETILDSESDIFWIIFKEGVEAYYKEYAPGFIVEFDKNSSPIGIEVRNWSRLIKSYPTSEEGEDSYNVVNFPEENLVPNYPYMFA